MLYAVLVGELCSVLVARMLGPPRLGSTQLGELHILRDIRRLRAGLMFGFSDGLLYRSGSCFRSKLYP